MKRIGLIGVSGYGGVVLRSLLAEMELSGAVLAAATVINSAEEEETCRDLTARGCRLYSDYEAMLDEWRGRLDLCVIPTGIHWHGRMAVDALRAGAHVLVEKPLAGSVAEGLEILDEAESAGKFVAVGFQDMYSSTLWDVKRYLLSRPLGKVRSIHVRGCWPRSRAYYERNEWAGRKYCGGRPVFDSPLSNAFAHMVNLGLWMASSFLEKAEVMTPVRGGLLRFFPIETYDSAALVLRGESGVEMECVLSHAGTESEDPSVTVEAERGNLSWNFEQIMEARDAAGRSVQAWDLGDNERSRRTMIRQVIGCIGTGEKPLCSADFALAHLRTLENIHRRLPVRDGRRLLEEPIEYGKAWHMVPQVLDRMSDWVGKQQNRKARKLGPVLLSESVLGA